MVLFHWLQTFTIAVLAFHGAASLGEWAFFRFNKKSTRYEFWTHTSGRIWRNEKGVMPVSRLTDALQDYWQDNNEKNPKEPSGTR